MNGFTSDIEELTERNEDFRRVIYTTNNMQLVVMSLRPGEEIGEETHDDRDQFFRVEDGEGEILIGGTTTKVKSNMAAIVPAGQRHNVRNTGDKPLKLYTIYTPPEHLDGTVHARNRNLTLPKSTSTERRPSRAALHRNSVTAIANGDVVRIAPASPFTANVVRRAFRIRIECEPGWQ